MNKRKFKEFDRYSGAILGLAGGDALGFSVEFMPRAEIQSQFGERGIREMIPHGNFERGTYSDDTQMTVSVANALLKSRTSDANEIMGHMSKEFVDWYRNPQNNRAPGITCMKGSKNLAAGVHWKESGVKGSKGCGAAMRSAPIGLVFYDDLDKLKEIAQYSATITHDSDVARASAVANAYLVARGIRNEISTNGNTLSSLENFTRGTSNKFTDKISQLRDLLSESPEVALREIGPGWNGHEAVAAGLYCALKNNFDYKKAVVMGANIDGDSDSVASIAGGIVGANRGFSKLPIEYLRPLENRDGLVTLSKQLYQKEFE